LDRYFTAMFGNYIIAYGKPQSGPFTNFLGGEKGFKNAREVFLGNAAAGIGHTDVGV
jgi:hypothetical protein